MSWHHFFALTLSVLLPASLLTACDREITDAVVEKAFTCKLADPFKLSDPARVGRCEAVTDYAELHDVRVIVSTTLDVASHADQQGMYRPLPLLVPCAGEWEAHERALPGQMVRLDESGLAGVSPVEGRKYYLLTFIQVSSKGRPEFPMVDLSWYNPRMQNNVCVVISAGYNTLNSMSTPRLTIF